MGFIFTSLILFTRTPSNSPYKGERKNLTPKNMKIFNILKNKILIFGFVFLVFGMFFGVDKAKTAQLYCCLEFKTPAATTGATTWEAISCQVQNKTCDTTERSSGAFLIKEASIPCMDNQMCKNAITADVKDCATLSESECPLGTGCVYLYDKCIKASLKSTSEETSAPSASTDCAKSPLGCNVDLSGLNRLNLKVYGAGGVQTLLGRAIKAMMGIIGSIALLMFVAGGFMWMTASGNAERTAKALKIITWSTLGIIVIFSAYILVQFVFSAF